GDHVFPATETEAEVVPGQACVTFAAFEDQAHQALRVVDTGFVVAGHTRYGARVDRRTADLFSRLVEQTLFAANAAQCIIILRGEPEWVDQLRVAVGANGVRLLRQRFDHFACAE